MSEQDQLLHALDELEATLQSSWSLADDRFDDSRKEALALRRVVVQQVAKVGSLGEQVLTQRGEVESFRSHFSTMRSAVALHHADWPIVAIKLDDPAYIASSSRMRRSIQTFYVWIRGVLLRR
jgi:hypothetical protein